MEIEEFIMVFCAAVSYFPVNIERFRTNSEASLREYEGIRGNHLGQLTGIWVRKNVSYLVDSDTGPVNT